MHIIWPSMLYPKMNQCHKISSWLLSCMCPKFVDIYSAEYLKHLPVASVLLQVLKGREGFAFLYSLRFWSYIPKQNQK